MGNQQSEGCDDIQDLKVVDGHVYYIRVSGK
jgi:hypothetical protein